MVALAAFCFEYCRKALIDCHRRLRVRSLISRHCTGGRLAYPTWPGPSPRPGLVPRVSGSPATWGIQSLRRNGPAAGAALPHEKGGGRPHLPALVGPRSDYHLHDKIHKIDTDGCWWCGSGERQSRHHLFTRCRAWAPIGQEDVERYREGVRVETPEGTLGESFVKRKGNGGSTGLPTRHEGRPHGYIEVPRGGGEQSEGEGGP